MILSMFDKKIEVFIDESKLRPEMYQERSGHKKNNRIYWSEEGNNSGADYKRDFGLLEKQKGVT